MIKKGIKIVIVFTLIISAYLLVTGKVYADQGDASCPPPFYVPPSCTTDFVPDLNCQANKISNPDDKCCPNVCPGSKGEIIDPSSSTYRKFVIFGTEFRLDPNKVPAVIKVVFQTFLGIVSIYALVRGVYVAGFKRTTVNTPDEIAKINKELTNLVIGFMICWGFILVVQVVGNFLGLGSLNTVSVGTSGGPVVVIK